MLNRSYDVFICYSRRDNELVRTIFDRLNRKEIYCFSDFESLIGSNSQEALVQAIKNAKSFLFICTPNSVQSAWAIKELLFAYKSGKNIIPVIVDGTELPNELEILLYSIQYINLDTQNIEEGLVQIENTILHRLSHHKQEPTAEIPQQDILPKEDVVMQPKGAAQRKEANKEKAKSILSKIGIAILFIFYILTVNMLFLNSNYIEGCLMLTPLLLLVVYYCFGIQKSRKFRLKLYCETENNSDSTLTISIDGEAVKTLKGKGFAHIAEKKGNYLITIESDNKEIASEKFIHTFNAQNNDTIKSVTLKRISSSAQAVKESDIIRYMCFIAGSTRLVNQRNAVRAVLSILYNKFEKHNLIISSYTFEDFKNHYTVEGQQMQYDEFIKTRANCAIFIVEDGIGKETLGEYRLAKETFKKSRQRPMIYIYANNLNSTDEYTQAFIEEARKDKCYWREYSDISTLMLKANEDIHSELFDIFMFNNKP